MSVVGGEVWLALQGLVEPWMARMSATWMYSQRPQQDQPHLTIYEPTNTTYEPNFMFLPVFPSLHLKTQN